LMCQGINNSKSGIKLIYLFTEPVRVFTNRFVFVKKKLPDCRPRTSKTVQDYRLPQL
jgi:hypothetical protein